MRSRVNASTHRKIYKPSYLFDVQSLANIYRIAVAFPAVRYAGLWSLGHCSRANISERQYVNEGVDQSRTRTQVGPLSTLFGLIGNVA